MWSDRQISYFAKTFKAKWASHWHLFVPAVQEALVDQEVLGIVVGQDKAEVSVPAIDSLRARMHVALGLTEERPSRTELSQGSAHS